MSARAEVNPAPHQLLALVRVLYPHAEMFLQAAPHHELLAHFLRALMTEKEALRQTFSAVGGLPRQQRADIYRGLAAGLAARYSNGEHAEIWNVVLSSVPELCGESAVPPSLPVAVAKRAPKVRVGKRLSAEQIEQRIYAVNSCAELIDGMDGTLGTIASRLNEIGVKVDAKRIQRIRSGSMARTLARGESAGACSESLLSEIKAGLELLADQQAANERPAPTPNREVHP